jgi:hypothetical protein
MRPPGSFADDPPPHASVFVVGQSNPENERGQPKGGGVRRETRSGEFVYLRRQHGSDLPERVDPCPHFLGSHTADFATHSARSVRL